MIKNSPYHFQRVIYIALFVILSFIFVSPFLISIILGATLALAMYPLQLKLQNKGWQNRYAAAFLTIVFTLVISIPFLFFVTKGTILVTDHLEKFAVNDRIQDQGVQEAVKTLRHEVIEKVLKYVEKFPVMDFLTEAKINQYLKGINQFLLLFFQNIATNIPTVILLLLVMIFCLFSFLKNGRSVREFFQSIFGFTDARMDQVSGVFLRNSRQVYLSNIITGAVQSLIVATGIYFIVDVDWFLVFFVTLILSFIPVIGAAPVVFVFAIYTFVEGNSTGTIILACLGVFTGLIDNILRPLLASFGETKAPPIVSFVFVLGGALILGFPGLFIGLLVGSLAYDTLPIFWEEIGKSKSGD